MLTCACLNYSQLLALTLHQLHPAVDYLHGGILTSILLPYLMTLTPILASESLSTFKKTDLPYLQKTKALGGQISSFLSHPWQL